MSEPCHLFPAFNRADIVRIVLTVWSLHVVCSTALVLYGDYYVLDNGPAVWAYVDQLIFLCVFSTTIVSIPTTLVALRLISRIIDNRRTLEHQAQTDHLTRLLNRRAFKAAAEEHLSRDHPGALLLIDVDHFKSINDTHGHAQGDEALIAIADTLRDTVRDGDAVGRIGGEEFAVLMTSGCLESAERLAERLRAEIEGLHMVPPGTDTRIELTISVGIAVIGPDTQSLDACYLAADTALYQAKQAGRNRVFRAEDDACAA